MEAALRVILKKIWEVRHLSKIDLSLLKITNYPNKKAKHG